MEMAGHPALFRPAVRSGDGHGSGSDRGIGPRHLDRPARRRHRRDLVCWWSGLPPLCGRNCQAEGGQMTDGPKIAAARIEVAQTRAALLETAKELQQRLQPKTLATEAWQKAKVKGADLAEDAVDAVKKRPVAVGGVVAALTIFLAREPIKDAVANLYDAMTSKKEPKRKAAALK